jgi:putative two-component system response regulator
MINLDDMIEKQTILVVDDNPENIHVLSGILRPYYKVKAAINGNIAIKIACGEEKPDIILLDIMMPELDGFAVCKYLKQLPETSEIPIVFVSAKSEVSDEKKGFELGAVDYITKPVSPPLVLARVSAHLKLADQKSHLMMLVKEKTADLEKTRLEIIESLGRAAEFKDNETGMHVVRMSWYSYYLAKRVTGNNNWSELLRNAAPMHDIGKIGIPDEVLLKPGKLDPEEWAIMQKHVEYGVEILGEHKTELLSLALEVAQYHHEKWDGSGYPKGVSGEDIPLSARIVAIADVFDALTSERPYKKAWTVEKTLALIESESGKHFDPDLVPKFIACLSKILKVKEEYTD